MTIPKDTLRMCYAHYSPGGGGARALAYRSFDLETEETVTACLYEDGACTCQRALFVVRECNAGATIAAHRLDVSAGAPDWRPSTPIAEDDYAI